MIIATGVNKPKASPHDVGVATCTPNNREFTIINRGLGWMHTAIGSVEVCTRMEKHARSVKGRFGSEAWRGHKIFLFFG